MLIITIILILFSSSTLIQIRKIIKTKSAKDLALSNWVITEIKLVFLLCLAILENSIYVSVSTAYGLVMNSVMVYLISLYGKCKATIDK